MWCNNQEDQPQTSNTTQAYLLGFILKTGGGKGAVLLHEQRSSCDTCPNVTQRHSFINPKEFTALLPDTLILHNVKGHICKFNGYGTQLLLNTVSLSFKKNNRTPGNATCVQFVLTLHGQKWSVAGSGHLDSI
jgi:hypothetical protein